MMRIVPFALICGVALTGMASAQDPFAGFKSNAEIRREQEAAKQKAAESGTPEVEQTDPLLRAELSATEVVPGQPVTLNITLLVPTYMPKPASFSAIDQPNLQIRTPEGGSGPVSERVNGDSWSGIRKRYEITPLAAGAYQVPEITVDVTWADAETGQPLETVLKLPAQPFDAKIPEGAEGMDPFIAASEMVLTQDISAEDALRPGDSLERIVTAKITGASGLMIPVLVPAGQAQGLSAYPDSAQLTQSDNRGKSTATRVERVVYVAQSGAEGALPAITLDWYNLESGKIETASVAAVPYVVKGAPVATLVAQGWQGVVKAGLIGIAGLALLLWGVHALRRRAARKALEPPSEADLFHALMRRVKAHDLHHLHGALSQWAVVFDGPDPQARPDVQQALIRLGEAHYSATPPQEGAAWQDLAKALSDARHAASSQEGVADLPPLNPTQAA